MGLYRAIEMPSDEPVQYVGCYVLRWGDWPLDPEVGFAPLDVWQIASKAVERIIDNDLTDRRGLKHEWRQIDPDIQEEIRQTWADIIGGRSRSNHDPNQPR